MEIDEKINKYLVNEKTSKNNKLSTVLKKLVKTKKLKEGDAEQINKGIYYIDPMDLEDLETWDVTDFLDKKTLRFILDAYLNKKTSIKKDGYVFKLEVKWGGLQTYVIYKNDKEVGQLPPNLKYSIVKKQIDSGKYKKYLK